MTNLVQRVRSVIAQLLAHPLRATSVPASERDFDERQEWDQAWSSQSHRLLSSRLRIDLINGLPFGTVVSATISADPPEFSNRVHQRYAECPVCGQTTEGVVRRAAHVHPEFENGVNSISFGVWVHDECYESCPETSRPAPIPW
jgi:hypothetical protein